LRHGEVSAPLRARAFGQLIEKTLYLSNGGLRFGELKNSLVSMVGTPGIAEDTINEAIQLLSNAKCIEKTKQKKWCLQQARHKEIEKEIERAENRRVLLCQRHFPSSISEERLRSWFEDACTAFFNKYSEIIVSLLSGGRPVELKRYSFALDEILVDSIRHHQLTTYKEQLISGFGGFIRSLNQQDQEELMNIVQATIASRFVTSDIGGDPLALEEFHEATFLLDTNVLFATSLEKHKIAKSLEATGKALQIINAKLKYVQPTKEEYENTVAYQTEQVMMSVGKFSRNVIEGANDLFIQTALARGCASQKDFECFFEEIKQPPKELCVDVPIVLLDNQDIEMFANEGKKDEKLKAKIRATTSPTRKNRPKGENTVNHDAALVYIVERSRAQGENIWILTLDTGMQELSVERAGEYGFPLWISVEALLQILAVDSQGTDIDPTDFAPLLSRILSTDYIPSLETYTSEDLCLLVEREDRITSLPDEKIKEIASKVRRTILQGKRKNDPELTLLVQREFQGFRLEHEEVLRKTKEEAEKERKDRESAELTTSKIQKRALPDRIKSIRYDALISLLKIILLSFGIGISIYLLFDVLLSIPNTLISYLVSIGAVITISIAAGIGKNILQLLNASKEAERQFEEER